jgi:3-oxo-5-alpha-steroid 4-dehydrogenase 1
MISHGTFNFICFAWIAVAIFIFPGTLKITQPYGRHLKSNWGPLMNNRAGWFIMELPALLIFGFFAGFKSDLSGIPVIAACMWGLHYINRALIFPFFLRTDGKKIPVVIVTMAIFFNTVNGFLNGYWLSHFYVPFNPGILTDARLSAGVILFLSGFVINVWHDRVLINLRAQGNGYKIPYGGLFKYVSCPNFFGETLIWSGFALFVFSLPALSFLIWTIVNLTPRARVHHNWYNVTFNDYPRNRKALIPFIL